ncbi:MAG: tail-specific protease [Chlorobi bacterium]|nr:tail-specific protease [Chlorobiota bacterium]
MKRFLTGLLLVLFVLSCNAQDKHTEELIARNQKIDSTKVIKPDALHSKIDRIITTILTRAHYKKFALNDSLSNVILDNYLNTLDANKLYFLQSDIDEFERYKNNFDDYLKAGDLTAAFDIFDRYKKRLGERIDYIMKRLKTDFDYTINEEYHPDRKDAKWAKTPEELDELWRLRLKNDALSAKLNGDDWEKISSTLKKRFKYFHKTILKYDPEDVFQLYINAFASAVDPHTNYFSPINAENFGINMSLSLEGIGAQLTTRNDYTTIVRIIPGGPAFKSGKLQVDDRIIGVAQGKDGEMIDVVGWRLDDVIQLIRGKKGTVVRLKIEKGDNHDLPPEELVLVRDKIKLEEQAAKSEIMELENNGKTYRIGIIDVPGFYIDFKGKNSGDLNYKSSTRDVKRLLVKLEKENVDGVIIDLRNNGGGSLQEAVNMTGLFIDRGPVVQVRNSDGSVDVGEDRDPQIVYSGPLAVMINRFSASASEIFAGAIQDYGRGLIIGAQSFGKGTVQNLIDLKRFMPSNKEKMGQVKLTVAKFYRITGSSTQLKGVYPDVAFPSAFDAKDFGEAASKSALPWDTIAPTKFHKYNEVAQFIPELEKMHEERIKKSPLFQSYVENVGEAVKRRNRNSFSLLESVRKKQREEAEAKKKKREEEQALQTTIKIIPLEEVKKDDEKKDKDKKEDPVLEESGYIFSDYISLKVG